MWNLGLLGAAGASVAIGTFELLQTATLTADAASVTFTSSGVWTDYEHLQVRMTGRTNRTVNLGIINVIFNGDTSTSYASHEMFGESPNSFDSYFAAASDVNIRVAFRVDASPAVANSVGAGVLDILDINSANKNTTTRSLSGNTDIVTLASGVYLKTDAITSMTFSPEASSSIISGSQFSLYGLRGA